MGEVIKAMCLPILVWVFVMGTWWGGSLWFDSIACEERSVSFERHKWGIFSGCMVKHNGKWLPLDNIRGFDDKG